MSDFSKNSGLCQIFILIKTVTFKFPRLESTYKLFLLLFPIKFAFVVLVTPPVSNALARTRQTGSMQFIGDFFLHLNPAHSSWMRWRELEAHTWLPTSGPTGLLRAGQQCIGEFPFPFCLWVTWILKRGKMCQRTYGPPTHSHCWYRAFFLRLYLKLYQEINF